MISEIGRCCARGVIWWIHRNPTYLLSAAAMALGARWYLVTPDAPAGEVGLILLTLGVLQVYELAVSSILIVLHRRRKSPEDQPSLLLVAALFWTGPMAATIEMTARHGGAGVGFAAAACLIALAELQAVRRAIGLRLSGWSQVAASGCVMLLAAAPAWLRVPDDLTLTSHGSQAATDEVALYLCWWLLSGLVLLTLGAPGWHARRRPDAASTRVKRGAMHVEMVFLGTVFAASAAHLWGMNHAFFANARAFYASPVLVALTVVLFEYLARSGARSRRLWRLCATLPAVAIALATEGFHEKVPVGALPVGLRDPLLATLLIAAAAWWYGYARGKSPLLLHVGSVALVAATFRMIDAPAKLPAGLDALNSVIPLSRDETAMISYALAVYLLLVAWLRRCRGEVLAALGVHLLAFGLLLWDRTPADLMSTCLLSGWSWLIALHVVMVRPRWYASAWPIAALIVVTGAFGLQAELTWHAGAHAVAMVVVLVVVGSIWPWTRYRTFGAVTGATFLTLAMVRGVTHGSHPKAAVAVLCAFLLLAAGAALSWYKRKLLALTEPSGYAGQSDDSVPHAEA